MLNIVQEGRSYNHDQVEGELLGRTPWTNSLDELLGRTPWTNSLDELLGRTPWSTLVRPSAGRRCWWPKEVRTWSDQDLYVLY
jgi:hypothetical protein